MDNPKTKKIKKKSPKPTVSHPAHKAKEKLDEVETLFGVHIISQKDKENHFGICPNESNGESENKKRE
ncbi:MAG TPA: hypothetical protein PKY59_01155 [Pyrinomonadaceae bacterium]|nr:hypothetical protein [Pyrinomonadaceae bacterium]